MVEPKTARRKLDGLRIIALLKLGKAALLLATTYGVYRLLDHSAVERLITWVATLTDSFERRLLLRALTWVGGMDGAKIKFVVAVTSAYTVLLLTEGVGLWLRQRWAEWLTVAASSSLIPFEVFQLAHRPHGHEAPVIAALTINVAIVIYLIKQLRPAAH